MKKLIILMLTMSVLSSCSINKVEKNKTEKSDTSVDVTLTEENIFKVAYNRYREIAITKNIDNADSFKVNSKMLEGDFNNDGIKDYLVYSDMNDRHGEDFYEVIVLTTENNKLKVMPSDITAIKCSNQKFEYDKATGVIVRTIYNQLSTSGGTFKSFYIANGDKITSTNTEIQMDWQDFDDETPIIEDSVVEGGWNNFVHTETVIDAETSKILDIRKTRYLLDKENSTYNKTSLGKIEDRETQIKELEKLLFEGNHYVLGVALDLVSEEEVELKQKIEYARYALWPNIVLPNDNPYKADIYYNENIKELQKENHAEIFRMVAESVQSSKKIEDLGAEKIEPNYEWENIEAVLGGTEVLQDIYNEHPFAFNVYKYDFNNDGIDELFMFFPGGAMGNFDYKIISFDSTGQVTNVEDGSEMGKCDFYKLNGEYFFVIDNYDFNDKQINGFNVYIFGDGTEIVSGYEALEMKKALRVVEVEHFKLSDILSLLNIGNSYNVRLVGGEYQYIQKYKSYKYEAIGNEVNITEEMSNKFNGSQGIYGEIDINNDGVNDVTSINKFFPSNKLRYSCSFGVIDGKTSELIEFENLDFYSDLADVSHYRYRDKNYLVLLYYNGNNYILKLVEIKGTRIVVIRDIYLSVLYDINIRLD